MPRRRTRRLFWSYSVSAWFYYSCHIFIAFIDCRPTALPLTFICRWLFFALPKDWTFLALLRNLLSLPYQPTRFPPFRPIVLQFHPLLLMLALQLLPLPSNHQPVPHQAGVIGKRRVNLKNLFILMVKTTQVFILSDLNKKMANASLARQKVNPMSFIEPSERLTSRFFRLSPPSFWRGKAKTNTHAYSCGMKCTCHKSTGLSLITLYYC